MKWNYISAAGIVVVAAFLLARIIAARFAIEGNKDISPGALSLIIEPNDGVAPVLAMIRGAARSVDLVIYELDDPQVEAALVADEARGVTVRVIVSDGYKGAVPTMYTASYDFLVAHGVPVRRSPAYFSLTHEKAFVVDNDRALIMTFNLVSKYYATGRDFGIFDDDRRDIAAMEDTFSDDWKGSGVNDPAKASQGGNNGDGGIDLVWSPGSEGSLIDLIHGARKSLYIYNEEMNDMDITKALIDAAERGIAIYVDMTGASEWKWEFKELATAGVHVRTYVDADDAALYIHAKMIVADAGSAFARAFVGSENFSATSLNENRELGIMISDQNIIAGLMKTFVGDWRGAAPFLL